ncbi:putative ABC transport system permease protein [Reichenbachiella faecimaris]|uniref:Putative ABC transport system permease protein n=1 Tax=Reichenbachiella faecimaris TaxID=692418 RepID=A0A1W2G8C9_REIFA|nr:ABC transporter permease [Reichenbachiella faecimaris]SMD32546.1 putative ABC transport system permease protein [Reichenbachiella faecimaris]
MLKNYFKIALRTLIKNKTYALINILGLSVGITCAALILLYVEDELTYDQFHTQHDQIYRVIESDHSDPSDVQYYGQTSPAVASAMKNDIPGVSNFTRIFQPGGHRDILWNGDKVQVRSYLIAESNFFDFFDFEFVAGDKNSALKEYNSIVLTESAATQFFGNENPIGKTMKWSEMNDVKVTAILKDLPENSHIQFTVLFSMNSIDEEGLSAYLSTWEDYGAYSYVLLDPRANIGSIESNFPGLVTKYDKRNTPEIRQFALQNLSDIYLNSKDIQYGITEANGNIFYINLFIGIAIFIMVVVCINYVNLSTAKATQRAKEIGLRKVSGASKGQLIFQFLIESIVLAIFSFLLSVLLIEILLPYFNEIAGKHFDLNRENIFNISLIIFCITIFLGTASGFYPALILSNLKPVASLKGEVKSNSMSVRSSLVVVQFAISIVMLVGALVIYQQMEYIKNKALGFDQNNMLVVDINNGNVRRNFEAMKTQLAQVPGVEKVATSSRVPGEWKGIRRVDFKPHQASQDSVNSYFMCFDEQMLETYDFELLEGTNFTGNKVTDSTKVILNEAAVKAMNLENPIGQTIYLSARNSGPMQIIGVVKDFHYQSLHNDIAPIALGYWANPVTVIDYFSLRLSTTNFSETLAGITAIHDQFDSETAIEWHFLDSQLNNFYVNDQRIGQLFGIGAVIMLIIAGFGLFGITSYMIDRRKKEIGVRKVLGSTGVQLVALLFRSYGKQVLIAFGVATPFAFYFANEWSSLFTYKETISVVVFLIAGLVVMLFTFLTVSYRVINAARLNPVDVLKDE